MSTCKKCGTEFEGNFCPECGTKFNYARVCRSCGEEVRGRYCIKCGTYYRDVAPEPTVSDVVLPSQKVVEDSDSSVRVCKNCGAAVSGRFCSACGTEYVSFQNTCSSCGTSYEGIYCPKCHMPVSRSIVEKKYWALTRMPLILFLTLAVALMGAYFGEFEVAYTNYRGTITIYFDWLYDLIDFDLPLYLFIFFLTLSATAITLFTIGMVNGTRKYKNFNLNQIFGIVGIAFMSVSCVNGAIAWTYCGSLGAPIMISVFSVSCLIPSVICLVESKLLVHGRNDYAVAEYRDRQRRLERKRLNYMV
ncbi:MAG: hypothetical protein LUD29_00680 [Clostridia bacterium]|nr:hypothetical protein [Clostridia bacterium]